MPSAAHKLLELGKRWYERGHLEEALELFEAARLSAITLNEPLIEARAWTHIGRASWLSCEPKVAEHAFQKSAACLARVADDEGAQTAKLRQVTVAYDAGDIETSRALLDEVEQRRALSPSVLGMAAGYRANIARGRDGLTDANEGYRAAISLLTKAGNDLYAATFTMDMAVVALLQRKGKLAWDTLAAARLTAGRAAADPMLSALLCHYDALAAAVLGEPNLVREAVQRFRGPSSLAMDFLTESHRFMVQLESAPAAHQEEAAQRLAALNDNCPPYEHGRLTMRILRGVVGGSTSRNDRLIVREHERSIRLGNRLEVRFLETSSEWRLLLALIAHHERREGAPVSVAELIEAGWPGESPSLKSGKNRLHVALSGLRKRGLREVLLRHEGGYALSRAIELIRSPHAQSESP